MNIGIVTTWFERGAAYVSRQYMNVLSQNNDVFIYARGGESKAIGDPNWDSDHVHWAENDYHTIIDLNEFEKWILFNSIDVVFFNEQQNFQAVLLCNKKGIKCGAYVDYYTEITVPFFKHYDFIICNTRHHYDVFKNYEQCFYIPWGTDVEIFKPGSDKLVEEGTVTFFHSAGFDPNRKGTRHVIEAFIKLREKYGKIVKLVVHTQRDLQFDVQKKTKLDATNGIEIIKRTVPAPGLFYKGDVYVYPSSIEGIGLTIAEALASGLPIIVTGCPPMNEFGNEFIRQEISVKQYRGRGDGYYWPYADIDVDDLYDRMEVYVNKIDELPALKKAARKYAEKYLNWSNNAKKLGSIFMDTKILKHDDDDINTILINDLMAIPGEDHMRLLYGHYKSIIDTFERYKDKNVFLYPSGNMTKQLLSILDSHNILISGIIDKNRVKIGNRESIHISDVKSNGNVIIITSSLYEESLRKDLRDSGYEGIVDTCFLYTPRVHDVSSLKADSFVMERMDLVLTTRCSLRCKKCANLMQYYKEPKDVDLDIVLKSMGRLLSVVDKILTVYVIGGEPLLYKRLSDVIHFLKRFDKIEEIIIVTNGTILPVDKSNDLWSELSANNILISISDYGALSRKKDDLVSLCKDHNVNIEVQEDLVFYDTGSMKKRNRDGKELAKVFRECGTKCRSLYNGRLYYCPRSAHGMDLGLVSWCDGDCVDLMGDKDDERTRRDIISLCSRTEPVVACDYCDIRVGDYYKKPYPPAEQ